MRPQKHPIRRERIRRPPKEGWSWIDRRFLREKASKLPREAVFLYFFLAAVSDKDGLSYWSDVGIAGQLRMTVDAVARTREELERHDLIAHEPPIYQVLSFPAPQPVRRSSGPSLLGDILGEIARRSTFDNSPAKQKGETS